MITIESNPTLNVATALTTAVVELPGCAGKTLHIEDCFVKVTTALSGGITALPIIALQVTRAGVTRFVATLSPSSSVAIAAGTEAQKKGIVNTQGLAPISAAGRLVRFLRATATDSVPGIYPGSVSTTAASAVVTGVGTRFLRDFIVGDLITIPSIATANQVTGVIVSITSDTSLTVHTAYSNTVASVRYVPGAIGNPFPTTDALGNSGATPSGKLKLLAGDVVSAIAVTAGTGGTPVGVASLIVQLGDE